MTWASNTFLPSFLSMAGTLPRGFTLRKSSDLRSAYVSIFVSTRSVAPFFKLSQSRIRAALFEWIMSKKMCFFRPSGGLSARALERSRFPETHSSPPS